MIKRHVKDLFYLRSVDNCAQQYQFEEIYSLKENYEVRESIEGTDQISIQKGMKKALSKLAINLSGDSNITNSNKIRSLLSSPERYVNQYKLINDEEEGLQAEFIFDGNLLRTYLSESEIPIWLSASLNPYLHSLY